MFKRILCIAALLMAVVCVRAQMPQLTPLPIDPKVKTGVLPNGLSYYIMSNSEPKERANFYIAQKVGSTLEEKDQLGLAHFLEHMAFNGLKHYPGKSMLEYLQSKGIRFGADINAYTSFDETVYNINNVPTTDANLMDSVLLVLHDWSGDILLEESEIDAERGVIQEEWRTRNDAQTRMLTAILPQIYEEYQYEQMPIGKMEVVMNFKPEALRSYYKKWYRPDQQGIVVVGDFDAAEMEKKVKAMFADIPMPENVAERVYPAVSDNKEPIYAAYTDKELRSPLTMISFKSDKTPFEMRNTVEMYMADAIMQPIIQKVINNRLSDYAQNPEAKYAGASVVFGDFLVSKTKDAFDINIVPKGDTEPAVAEVMEIVMRALKGGLTDTEIDRAKSELLASYENAYNEREKTNSDAHASELIRLFVDNIPAPGIETEYQLAQQIMPMVSSAMINPMLPQIATKENIVIVTTEPEKEGFKVAPKESIVNIINSAIDKDYEAYVDEVITEPLISKLPTPGKVVSVTDAKLPGVKEYTLSNGVHVFVKPTDFTADEIQLTAWRNGGLQNFTTDQAPDALFMDKAVAVSKMGPFDNKTLQKYMAGKKAGVGFQTGTRTDEVMGYSTVKDFRTMMEQVYTLFTALGEDNDTYTTFKQNRMQQLGNLQNTPNYIFGMRRMETTFDGNPLMMPASTAALEAADYGRMLAKARETLSNAADYTFLIVGNVDETTLVPMLEQYIATLPASGKSEYKPVTEIKPVRGDVKNEFKQPMQSPGTTVIDMYSDYNIPYTLKNDVMLTMVTDILEIIFTNTLREEEGGTYGASVASDLSADTGMWQILYYFQTNADQQAALIARADAELQKLLQEGAPEADFNKVKEATIKQFEISDRDNSFWMQMLGEYSKGRDSYTELRKTIESVTLPELNAFMKGLYTGKNRIQVIMEGVQAE